MKYRVLTLALASAGMLLIGSARADADINFSGFGTLGVTHSNNGQADFVGSILQPNGAGRSSPTMFGIDTKAGVQATTKIGNDLTATVQVVSDHRFDNSYAPRFEWANLKYQINKDLYVRAGRVVAPVFMVSDYRNVGYSQTPVRMPFEVYGQNPISHLDGGELGARFDVAGGVLGAQVSGGRVKEHTPDGSPNGIEVTGTAKLASLSFEYGPSTVRVGYAKTRVDANSDNLSMVDIMYGYGAFVGHPQSSLLHRGIEMGLWDFGYAYDSGNWLAQGEFVTSRGGWATVKDQDVWYLLAGYRVGKFTPYASYSQMKSKEPQFNQPTAVSTCSPCMLDQLAYGINVTDATLRTIQEQRTVSLGVRYDFYKNLALKAQYDHVRKPGSTTAPNVGAFLAPSVVSPSLYSTFATTDNTVNLATLTLDFVF